MKFVFELYEETNERGRVFLGYKTINSDSAENAKTALLSSVPDNIQACQIYYPQGV